jgi:hypothetical protein
MRGARREAKEREELGSIPSFHSEPKLEGTVSHVKHREPTTMLTYSTAVQQRAPRFLFRRYNKYSGGQPN